MSHIGSRLAGNTGSSNSLYGDRRPQQNFNTGLPSHLSQQFVQHNYSPNSNPYNKNPTNQSQNYAYPRPSTPNYGNQSPQPRSNNPWGNIPNQPFSSSNPNISDSGLYQNGYYNQRRPIDRSYIDAAVDLAGKTKETVTKNTRIMYQQLGEKYGKRQGTVDQEVQQKLNTLHFRKEMYRQLKEAASAYTKNIEAMAQSQKILGEKMREFSMKTPELSDYLNEIGDTQCRIAHEEIRMVQASQRFSSGLETLVDKTIKDVLETAEQLNNTRLELDAYRNTLEANPYSPNVEITHKSNVARDQYARQREKLMVKIELLDENRTRVLHENLKNLEQAQQEYYRNCDTIVGGKLQMKTESSNFDLYSTKIEAAFLDPVEKLKLQENENQQLSVQEKMHQEAENRINNLTNEVGGLDINQQNGDFGGVKNDDIDISLPQESTI